MPSLFSEYQGPQPPKLLRTAREIAATLTLLEEKHTPLLIRFPQRAQHFQSFLIAQQPSKKLIALDEMIPRDAEQLLRSGQSFHVEAFLEGIRVTWESSGSIQFSTHNGLPSYWLPMPEEMTYHQRRNAYRVSAKAMAPIRIELAGGKLVSAISGYLRDLSATGCGVQFKGDVSDRLAPGEVYDCLQLQLPFGGMSLAAEVRHIEYQEKSKISFVGIRFHMLSGIHQRQLERFVHQAQRESRTDD